MRDLDQLHEVAAGVGEYFGADVAHQYEVETGPDGIMHRVDNSATLLGFVARQQKMLEELAHQIGVLIANIDRLSMRVQELEARATTYVPTSPIWNGGAGGSLLAEFHDAQSALRHLIKLAPVGSRWRHERETYTIAGHELSAGKPVAKIMGIPALRLSVRFFDRDYSMRMAPDYEQSLPDAQVLPDDPFTLPTS